MATGQSLTKFRNALAEQLLELLWRQWRAAGIAAHGPRSQHLLDLEALILATAIIGKQDRRLLSSSRQWLVDFREWVNLSRLKHMAQAFTRPDAFLKMPLAEKRAWAEVFQDPRPLHPTSAKKGRASWIRPARATRPPLLQKSSLLQLYLRGIFGINARAEIFLFLLLSGKGNSNQIARETQYDQKNIYRILERWAETGFVFRESGLKQNLYSLAPGNAFLQKLAMPHPFWCWPRFFLLFARLFVAATSEPWVEDTYLFSSLLRDIHSDAAAIATAVGSTLPAPELFAGEEFFWPMAHALLDVLKRFVK